MLLKRGILRVIGYLGFISIAGQQLFIPENENEVSETSHPFFIVLKGT